MSKSLIVQDLRKISSEDELLSSQDEMVGRWLAAEANISDVEVVLKFMERRPTWQFGTPGALVRFVEKFFRKGYEEKLVESVNRQPTFHTLWMLNRISNGEDDARKRAVYMDLFSQSFTREDVDEAARSWAREFFELQKDNLSK